MADIIMVVDTAVLLPVNLLPLLDDTDFKTVEDAIAYNAAGMDLRWNFVTPAGVITSTPIVPTTAGVYDWAHLGDGMYTIELPASGGGGPNNNAAGFGWISGRITGVLPFRGPVIQFSPAHIAHGLVTGTEYLRADPCHTEWSIAGNVQTVYKPDGTTAAYTKNVGTTGGALPVTSVT
jgi:hypothetical protein